MKERRVGESLEVSAVEVRLAGKNDVCWAEVVVS